MEDYDCDEVLLICKTIQINLCDDFLFCFAVINHDAFYEINRRQMIPHSIQMTNIFYESSSIEIN